MAQRIEIWPIDRLVPYANNARTHSPEQVSQIAASIVEFGFVNPRLRRTLASSPDTAVY
jgi:ParB-like chromosome segregation protein Spo0J